MLRQKTMLWMSVGVCFGMGLPSAWAAEDRPPENRIWVQGQCERSVAADRGRLTLVYDMRDLDLQLAVKKAIEANDKLVASIKMIRLEKSTIETHEYSVTEIRENEKDKGVVSKGYRVRIGVTVSTSQPQRLGEVIELAGRFRVSEVGSLWMDLSPEQMRHETLECLKEAVENAKEKASKMAEALGRKVGMAVSVTEQNLVAEDSVPRGGVMMVAAPAPKVEVGHYKVQRTASVGFELKF